MLYTVVIIILYSDHRSTVSASQGKEWKQTINDENKLEFFRYECIFIKFFKLKEMNFYKLGRYLRGNIKIILKYDWFTFFFRVIDTILKNIVIVLNVWVFVIGGLVYF